MELTNEQYQTLQPYESYLMTAYENNYVRSLPMKDAVRIKNVYTELGYGSPSLSCPKCVLNICKTLGKLYSYKKRQYEEREIK